MKATKLKNFAVICLAAGKSQLPVIEKAKSLGIKIIDEKNFLSKINQ